MVCAVEPKAQLRRRMLQPHYRSPMIGKSLQDSLEPPLSDAPPSTDLLVEEGTGEIKYIMKKGLLCKYIYIVIYMLLQYKIHLHCLFTINLTVLNVIPPVDHLIASPS